MRPLYTLSIEGPMIILVDTGRGRSITNAAEDVVRELYELMGNDIAGRRIIYRDTMQMWDGLAHRRDRFLDFVPLQEADRARAVEKALALADWPT